MTFAVRRNAKHGGYDMYVAKTWIAIPFTQGASLEKVAAVVGAEAKGARIVYASYEDVK